MQKNQTGYSLLPAITLQEIVDRVLDDALPAAHHNHTHVLNEIGRGIALGPEVFNVVGVIDELLKTVIGNSRHGEIHITADHFRDVIVLQVEERNNYNGYALAYSIGSIEPEALALGGHISIKGQQQKITTISFSFPVHTAAA